MSKILSVGTTTPPVFDMHSRKIILNETARYLNWVILVDADDKALRDYSEKLNDVSTDISIKYLRVFSIIDNSYQEYLNWKQVLPYYRNISEEGMILYAA